MLLYNSSGASSAAQVGRAAAPAAAAEVQAAVKRLRSGVPGSLSREMFLYSLSGAETLPHSKMFFFPLTRRLPD